MTQPRVSPLCLCFFLPVIPRGRTRTLDTKMDTTQVFRDGTNGTDEKWSGTFQWEKRDSRLDNFPMMTTLWPTIGVTALYALGAGILLRGRLNCCIIPPGTSPKHKGSNGNVSPCHSSHFYKIDALLQMLGCHP